MQARYYAIFLCGLTTVAIANPDVTSREYKLMLNPAWFTSGNEASNVNSYFQAAKTQIQQQISRDITGTMTLSKTRQVRFFDSPNTCLLKNKGYIFRERVENGQSEVTLKYRGYDQYIAAFEDLSGSSSQAETKFEEDIGSKNGQSFVAVFSHSTTEPNTRTLNDFQDVNVHFPAFATHYAISNSQPLSVVSNFTAYERVYKGGSIDLGQFDAQISVTLWYNGVPSVNTQPVTVEASFKYEDPYAAYTKQVVNRANLSFSALQAMNSWVSTTSATKTQYAYEYSPNFCS